jgi:hypothetical protein
MNSPQSRGPNTNNTLSELQNVKRAIANKTFHPDGYSDASKDIITDIKYLKNKQKQNAPKTTNSTRLP